MAFDPITVSVASIQAETQAAIAAKIVKMQVDNERAVVGLLNAAAENLKAASAAASPPAGTGLVVNRTA